MTVLDITALEDLPPYLRTPEVAKILRTTENASTRTAIWAVGCPTSARVAGFCMTEDQVLAHLRQHTVQPGDSRPVASRD